MSFFCLKESKPAKSAYKQLQPTELKLLRRICKIEDSGENAVDGQNNSAQQADNENAVAGKNNSAQQADINPPGDQGRGDGSGQRELSRLTSFQQKPASADKTDPVNKSKEEVAVAQKFEDTFPRFGPAYRKDPDPFETAKQETWRHVLNKTTDPDEESSTLSGIYLSAIKKIEKEARDTYDPPIVAGLKKSEFQWIMLIDGCFFLQLALYILGGSELLDYPKNHVYFGLKPNDREINRWIKAMFFLGNQVPCVVIRVLMKQRFFQNVIEKGTWYPPTDNLPKMVLYLLIVLPELQRSSSSGWLFSKFKGQKGVPHFRETPSDILHGLHCLVLGPENDPLDWETKDALDLEAGTQELDRKNRFPSARELEQKGIKLNKANGVMGIHFKKRFFLLPRLYVPPFTVDDNTQTMLWNLKTYEIQQKLGNNKCDVGAYIRFMGDLVQTQKDAKILEGRGIIKQVKTKNDEKDSLPVMLSKLGSEEITFTQNVHLARIQVIGYSGPQWDLVALALFFTVVQTVFTVLSYFLPFKKN